MQQVKIFKSIESEITSLEEEINAWIKETGAKNLHISGNIAPQTQAAPGMGSFSSSDILITILFEAKPKDSGSGEFRDTPP
ncbi:MAG: hypothetical protein HN617_07520 [Planctomycetaceae bacterium]|jgi:hypothetical protein|nr:hypothetical protein [Planctomycetaceae bacterium]MBT4013966.1 hypothetical protein [Planctomycetaceae bacterium]MBT4724520.1 hypothetical protein [Planctomycetaceae bacterium]MBT4846524.1 hypothetical protein [Planctomycetaceae bacterium]MBT5125827.1 hypothetical protein [Planctomycetaceae bacterium]